MDLTLVNLNGKIHTGPDLVNSASISVFDRSFLYGDSLYEVARTVKRKLYALEEHLDRLISSAALARMPLTESRISLAKLMSDTCSAFYELNPGSSEELYCRIIVSRGSGKIGFGLKNVETPNTVVVIVEPMARFAPPPLSRGAHLRIVDRLRNDPRALSPALKSGNYLNNLLAFLEAQDDGDDDGLLCNSEGHLTEGTTFNFFYVKSGIVVTPPVDIGILVGITRDKVIRLCQELGLPCREVRFPKERLYEADEAFITSTLKDVYPITRVDQKKIGTGQMGPITQKLKRAFEERELKI